MKAKFSPQVFLIPWSLVCAAHVASAQINDTISGAVVDSASRAAMAGVAVASEGVSQMTGLDGGFRLILPSSSSGVIPSLSRGGSTRFERADERIFLALPGFPEPGIDGMRDLSGRLTGSPAGGRYPQGYGFAEPAPFSGAGGSGSRSRAAAERPSAAAKTSATQATAITAKAHTLSFSKTGYASRSVTVEAGATGRLADVGLAVTEIDPGIGTLETIEVPGTGNTVVTKIALDKGELFLLKASGTAGTGDSQQDAEYGQFAAGGKDSVGGLNVGVDVGIPEGRPTKYVPAGRTKWFGGYRADHVYRMIVTGTGAPLSIKLIPPAGSDGSGSIRVSVLRLSPTPTLPAVLDSIKVPYIKQTVHSAITCEKGKVYLMQASGSGKVGGANLGLGDAEWMDWDANGAGKVDIGDGNVD
jgi:hypothetical protein